MVFSMWKGLKIILNLIEVWVALRIKFGRFEPYHVVTQGRIGSIGLTSFVDGFSLGE